MAIPRHSRGTASKSSKWLNWTLLLLYASSVSGIASGSDPPRVQISQKPHAGRSPAEIPQLTHNISPKFRNTNEDAKKYGQALAPASLQPAVRAPTTQSIESEGLSLQDGARRLVDWEADDMILLATIDGALHARDRRSGRRRWELKMPDSMIETVQYSQNRSHDDGLGPIKDDYIFIVEPSGDGQLYAQFSDPSKGLIRLSATVRKMATEVPFQMQMDGQWLAVNSQQESKTYTIDAQTGDILYEFPRSRSIIRAEPAPRCRPRSGLDFEDSACKPGRTLRLGRNTYTFTISNENTGQDLCTIRFSEWATNKLDSDLQRQHLTSLDNYDVHSDHNGGFVGIDLSAEPDRRHRYHETLDSPIARVFDVARRVDEEDDSTDLMLLARSSDFIASRDVALFRQDPVISQRVFVNCTSSGQWFALSELNYPGVTTRAKLANVARDWYNEPIDLGGPLHDIIGVHLLAKQKHTGEQLTIGEQPHGGVPAELILEPEKELVDQGTGQPSPLIRQKKSESRLLENAIVCTVIALILGVLAWFTQAAQLIPVVKGLASMDMKLQIVPRERAKSTALVPEQQLVAAPTVAAEVLPAPDLVSGQTFDRGIPATPGHSRAPSTVGLASPRKEREENEGDDSEDENDAGEAPVEKKKKTKRGNRGGRGRKKNKSTEGVSFEPKPIISQEKHLRDGFVQVGRLTYDGKLESCLGQGSSGTAVFPGTFDGRVVAVKRLVKTANSLAEKEIRHLVNSDSHPNVVRYIGKEESPSFFFIALDRFDTSLDRFVELPHDFPSLVCPTLGYDVKDALRQITQGVQHLHSLKLVHRDIKPQNILVRPVKSARPITGLTPLLFVISDFGLCKPLEDGPESVFAATRTAAGTTGWKAPELLVSSRDAIAAPMASVESQHSSISRSISHTASSSISEGEATAIDPPTGRRATKAIDIFSLGCVFFYVLTRGAHPFDKGGSPLARDLNIKEDNFDTSLLRESFVGYDYDADDLIMQMIMHNPKERPDTTAVLAHPYFWSMKDKLEFICLVSDAYEERKQLITNIHDETAPRTAEENLILEELAALQEKAPNVIGLRKDGSLQSFLDALPRSFLNEMGKQRKYTGTKMIDLLRVIRNKKNHYHSLPLEVQELMTKSVDGSEGRSHIEGYYSFWRDRFPSLLVNCHQLLHERGLVDEFGLQRFYDGIMSS